MHTQDELSLRRLCADDIPEEVTALYDRWQRIWNKVGASECNIQTLALMVAVATTPQPEQPRPNPQPPLKRHFKGRFQKKVLPAPEPAATE